MIWLETTSDEEAIARSEHMWTPAVQDVLDGGLVATAPGPDLENGKFWADAINDVHDDPCARIAIARRHLPVPAAFREIAIGLRALIRKARKERAEYEPWLRELHHFAAISSWSLPYNEIAQAPGFNVLERTPYARLAGLDLSWDTIGCDELPDLNKTDRTLMRQIWGEPRRHTTANALYRDLWIEGCRKVADGRERQMEGLLEDLRELGAHQMEQREASGTSKPSLFVRLLGRR